MENRLSDFNYFWLLRSSPWGTFSNMVSARSDIQYGRQAAMLKKTTLSRYRLYFFLFVMKLAGNVGNGTK